MIQLPITMTELGPGKGFMWSSKPSMNCAKRRLLKDPSMMSTARMPSNDKAGRIEYLAKGELVVKHAKYKHTSDLKLKKLSVQLTVHQ